MDQDCVTILGVATYGGSFRWLILLVDMDSADGCVLITVADGRSSFAPSSIFDGCISIGRYWLPHTLWTDVSVQILVPITCFLIRIATTGPLSRFEIRFTHSEFRSTVRSNCGRDRRSIENSCVNLTVLSGPRSIYVDKNQVFESVGR